MTSLVLFDRPGIPTPAEINFHTPLIYRWYDDSAQKKVCLVLGVSI